MDDGNRPFENDVVSANLQLENQQFDQSLANVKLQQHPRIDLSPPDGAKKYPFQRLFLKKKKN